ncbi:hypothetical protein Sj15T_17860 [Sphingobium sp. TA15]|uniref:Uncharacterized protein n=1 Tax=Sphingobium indicum (strain DSM 16413 / CCM 7287 / MTCC 6362 / UT26 / NBRC 101211 / UT26S) TaxID=452662 RepID=D4Z417_SPHIU|nr:hypothetical protein SJA_C1-25150 [Sphingobium indicum UT26S]BDD66765.1 hypothetical protein Sj15T_17860 [Sphingobium sp. TA15]
MRQNSLIKMDEELVSRLELLVTSRKPAELSETLGISYNTFRKLLAGQPIRGSVAVRLKDRVREIERDLARVQA